MGINNLPAELLAQILVLHAADTFERLVAHRLCFLSMNDAMYAMLRKNTTTFHDFANITQVCKRWRKVALECPAFWSKIIIGPSENTERMLVRSKKHPLNIFCTLQKHKDHLGRYDALRLTLVNHSDRLRSLQLCFFGPHSSKEDHPLYTALSAPLLEDLTAYFEDNVAYNYVTEVGWQWIAPRLRRYKVCGGHPGDLSLTSWPALQFKHTLTQLVWLPAEASSTLFPSAESILSVLGSLPSLETLHIAFSFMYPVQPYIPLVRRERLESVRLPRLRSLVLKGNLDTCIDILEHITYPMPLRQFGILAQSSSADTARPSVQLTDFLAELIKPHHDPGDATLPAKRLRTISIRPVTLYMRGIELMGWREGRSPLDFPATHLLLDQLSQPAYENLDVCLSLPPALPRVYLERIFDGVLLDAVEALQLGVKVEDDNGWHRSLSSASVDLAQRLTDVKELVIGHVRVTPAGLIRTLFAVPAPNTRGPGRCPYRQLRRLRIAGFTIPSLRAGYDEAESWWEEFGYSGDEDDDSDAAIAYPGDDLTFEDFLSDCIRPLKQQGINLDQLMLVDLQDPLRKKELVRLRALLGAEVLCDSVHELKSNGSLYRTPDTVEGRWERANDELQSDESDETGESGETDETNGGVEEDDTQSGSSAEGPDLSDY